MEVDPVVRATDSPQPAKAIATIQAISIRKIAGDLDYSPSWVSRCLNGEEKPSAEFARRLAAYLDVPAEGLFADADVDVVAAFVKRTTVASGVSVRLDDPATAQRVASMLRNGL